MHVHENTLYSLKGIHYSAGNHPRKSSKDKLIERKVTRFIVYARLQAVYILKY